MKAGLSAFSAACRSSTVQSVWSCGIGMSPCGERKIMVLGLAGEEVGRREANAEVDPHGGGRRDAALEELFNCRGLLFISANPNVFKGREEGNLRPFTIQKFLKLLLRLTFGPAPRS